MNFKALIGCLMLVAIASYQLVASENELSESIVPQVIEKPLPSFQFLDQNCPYQLKPKIINFILKWEGRVWCPELATVIGKAFGRTRSEAIENAIKNYAQQIVEEGIVDKSQVQIWLQ